MKKILICIVGLLCFYTFVANASEWRFPGEFEEQEAVWVGWLSKEYIAGYHTDNVMLPIVQALIKHVDVVIGLPDVESEKHVRKILSDAKVEQSRISFFITPFTVPYWRDYGPIFLKNDKGNLKIADFCFNMWGYYPIEDLQSRFHEKIDRNIADSMELDYEMTRVVSEGGDRILNGRGILIVVEACEFQRNPNMSHEELEEEYKRILGVSKVIWLKQGTYDDDSYNQSVLPGPDGKGVAYRSASANNHADEFCRFVDANTILLAEVSEEDASSDPIAAENRRRMEANYEILKNATDQNGKPFRIVRIPMPETIYFTAKPTDEVYVSLFSSAQYTDGTCFPLGKPVQVVPATSYCNFLISNGIVLAQKYWEPGMPVSIRQKDEDAKKVLQKLFPNREVVTITTTALNFGGGGIHCATQQQPKK
ncbi:MAG: agmatine deiminase family protein [Thermodesulfobacteriota bacterium]|nr:agmatine deiminase family protein [Thermodesulfobacteriota bacterium]